MTIMPLTSRPRVGDFLNLLLRDGTVYLPVEVMTIKPKRYGAEVRCKSRLDADSWVKVAWYNPGAAEQGG